MTTALTPPKPEPVMIGCRDECGAKMPVDKIEGSGWEYLEIQKRYRCSACGRALKAINTPKDES